MPFRRRTPINGMSNIIIGTDMTKLQKKLWRGLLILALLTPLGILLPAKYNAGEAWGEWGTDSLAKLIGYVPEGLKRLSSLWAAPMPDYGFGGEQASFALQLLSYILSGLLGMLVVGLAMYLIFRLMGKHEK
jgi:cobalt/nickel transport protein